MSHSHLWPTIALAFLATALPLSGCGSDPASTDPVYGTGAAPGSGGAVGSGGLAATGAAPGTGGGFPGTGGSVAGSGGGGTYVPGSTYGAVCSTFGGQDFGTAFADLYADWVDTQVVTCGDGARVQGCPHPDASATCSEAQAYGMLIAIAAEDKVLFDRLNTYRLQMLLQSSTADNSLMPWAIWSDKSCPPVAQGGDQNSATDADVDAALALLQAHALWGEDAYESQALSTLNSIKSLEIIGSGASLKLKPGNHDGDNRDYVAYYTPAYYSVFSELTGDSTWLDLGSAYYTRLLANQCPSNGQIYDDFANPGECKFWWDSCRVPWRVALDYQWHQSADAKAFLDKLNGFVGTDPTSISDQKNSAFAGGGVLSAMSSDDPNEMQALCNAWASASLDDSAYFQKTLKLLYLMVAGGRFIRP